MACVIGRQGLIQVRGAAPVVSYEVPLNAATSGGATVTISGLSFGVYGYCHINVIKSYCHLGVIKQ